MGKKAKGGKPKKKGHIPRAKIPAIPFFDESPEDATNIIYGALVASQTFRFCTHPATTHTLIQINAQIEILSDHQAKLRNQKYFISGTESMYCEYHGEQKLLPLTTHTCDFLLMEELIHLNQFSTFVHSMRLQDEFRMYCLLYSFGVEKGNINNLNEPSFPSVGKGTIDHICDNLAKAAQALIASQAATLQQFARFIKRTDFPFSGTQQAHANGVLAYTRCLMDTIETLSHLPKTIKSDEHGLNDLFRASIEFTKFFASSDSAHPEIQDTSITLQAALISYSLDSGQHTLAGKQLSALVQQFPAEAPSESVKEHIVATQKLYFSIISYIIACHENASIINPGCLQHIIKSFPLLHRYTELHNAEYTTQYLITKYMRRLTIAEKTLLEKAEQTGNSSLKNQLIQIMESPETASLPTSEDIGEENLELLKNLKNLAEKDHKCRSAHGYLRIHHEALLEEVGRLLEKSTPSPKPSPLNPLLKEADKTKKAQAPSYTPPKKKSAPAPRPVVKTSEEASQPRPQKTTYMTPLAYDPHAGCIITNRVQFKDILQEAPPAHKPKIAQPAKVQPTPNILQTKDFPPLPPPAPIPSPIKKTSRDDELFRTPSGSPTSEEFESAEDVDSLSSMSPHVNPHYPPLTPQEHARALELSDYIHRTYAREKTVPPLSDDDQTFLEDYTPRHNREAYDDTRKNSAKPSAISRILREKNDSTFVLTQEEADYIKWTEAPSHSHKNAITLRRIHERNAAEHILLH